MSTQPEALRLADLLERDPSEWGGLTLGWKAAAELRRLHALNAELVDALKRCFELMSNGGTWTLENQNAARAAIAKATGDELLTGPQKLQKINDQFMSKLAKALDDAIIAKAGGEV